MQTANFRSAGKHESAVAICRGVPEWFIGRHFMELAPTAEMLRDARTNPDAERFAKDYKEQILGKLDPKKVFHKLGPDAILLCWESFNERCHRRLVAEWFEETLGIVVPELGRPREACKPFLTQRHKKPRWPVRPKKEPTPAPPSLFDEPVPPTTTCSRR